MWGPVLLLFLFAVSLAYTILMISFAQNERKIVTKQTHLGVTEIHGSTTTNTTQAIENQKVFIVTLPRSGSTFIGELFRQNPDFAYLFEPLRAFSEQFSWDNCNAKPYDERLEGIMKAVFGCDFATLNKSFPDWGPLYGWDRINQFSGHTNTCFPPESDTPEAKKMSIAVKEIEMWAPKLDWLQSILNSDLYVLWLVRDVRGWVSSWVVENPDTGNNFYSDWGLPDINFWNYYASCNILVNNKIVDDQRIARIKDILTNTTAEPYLKMAALWTLDTAVSHHYITNFNGKAKLVTYEQLASHPLEETNLIYSFLDRSTVPDPVLDYLHQATQGGAVEDRYATNRNSTAMTDIWHRRLTPEQIKNIEEIAGVWFPFFGYEKIY